MPRDVTSAARRALPLPGRPAAAAGRVLAAQGLVKDYETPVGRRRVIEDVSFTVRAGQKIAVLGRNGSGKSTLVKLLGGVERPTAGTVHRGLALSWPLGFAGGLEGEMTGTDNVRFIARLYGKPLPDVVAFVDDFAELGRQIHIPVKNYSSGMRMRLAFALTLAVEFECLLIDEVLSVGDQRFHRKCHDALFVERRHCAMVLVSHDVAVIESFCDSALVLKAGRGRIFDDVGFALDIYRSL